MIRPRTCSCGAAMEYRVTTAGRYDNGIYLCAHCDRTCEGVGGKVCASCHSMKVKK